MDVLFVERTALRGVLNVCFTEPRSDFRIVVLIARPDALFIAGVLLVAHCQVLSSGRTFLIAFHFVIALFELKKQRFGSGRSDARLGCEGMFIKSREMGRGLCRIAPYRPALLGARGKKKDT